MELKPEKIFGVSVGTASAIIIFDIVRNSYGSIKQKIIESTKKNAEESVIQTVLHSC